jgi:hypothetical protein
MAIGLSGVYALPLGLRRTNVLATLNVIISLLPPFSSQVLTFLPEWVVVGFQNLAWAPNSQNLYSNQKKIMHCSDFCIRPLLQVCSLIIWMHFD